jgi:hypothetical protein
LGRVTLLMVCLRCGAQPSGKPDRFHAPPFTSTRGLPSFCRRCLLGTQRRTTARVAENRRSSAWREDPKPEPVLIFPHWGAQTKRGASSSCASLQFWFSRRCLPVVPPAAALKTLFPRGQIRHRRTPRPSMPRAATSQKAAAQLQRNRNRRGKHNQRRASLRQRQNNRRRSPTLRTHPKSRLAGCAV